MIRDDEICMIVCAPATAKLLIEEEDDVRDSLIITSAVEDDEAIVVPKQDFLDWLYEEGKYAD